MGQVHVVAAGEHLSQIAERHGFLDVALIWDHPRNEALRSARESFNVLLPGDELFVPDKEAKVVGAPTDATHRFVVQRPALQLRVAFLDFHGQPLGGMACELEVEGSLETLSADGDGVVQRTIPRHAAVGVVSTEDTAFPIRIGGLDPVDAESGWKARLVNLGYLDSDALGDDPRAVQAALEEFQCDRELPLTGEPDAATLEALKAFYGC